MSGKDQNAMTIAASALEAAKLLDVSLDHATATGIVTELERNLHIIRRLRTVRLGETTPAFHFSAGWNDDE